MKLFDDRVKSKCFKTSLSDNKLEGYEATLDGVKKEFDEWFNKQYGNKTKKERQKLGAFYTPPELSVRMVNKLGDINEGLLDPTVGAGGLLAAAIILRKVDPKNCFGIELDEDTANIARNRLDNLGVPPYNIHVGDALYEDHYKPYPYRFYEPETKEEELELLKKNSIDPNGWLSLKFK